MQNLSVHSSLARVPHSPSRPSFAGFGRRLTRPFQPAPDNRFVSGKGSLAAVVFGPGFGRRVQSRGLSFRPAHTHCLTLLPHTSCSTQHSSSHPGTKKAVRTTFVPPGLPKECLIKIRNARRLRCQGNGRWQGPANTLTPLYRPLRICLLVPYRKGRLLDIRGPPGSRAMNSTRLAGGRKEVRRHDSRNS
jgi:hypothetical protein